MVLSYRSMVYGYTSIMRWNWWKCKEKAQSTDRELIATALYVYWEQARYAGDPRTAARAYELYLEYASTVETIKK